MGGVYNLHSLFMEMDFTKMSCYTKGGGVIQKRHIILAHPPPLLSAPWVMANFEYLLVTIPLRGQFDLTGRLDRQLEQFAGLENMKFDLDFQLCCLVIKVLLAACMFNSHLDQKCVLSWMEKRDQKDLFNLIWWRLRQADDQSKLTI